MAVTAFKATNEAPTTFKLVVPKEHARMRLDLFLVKSLPEFSRSRIQQLIRGGFVREGRGVDALLLIGIQSAINTRLGGGEHDTVITDDVGAVR